MPGRPVSAQALQAARLRAHRAQRPEGLSRRRRALAPAVRDLRHRRSFCGKTDCRHVAATLGERAGLRDPVTLHNFYVPAGGDEPDPDGQSEIRAQARRSSTRCATATRCAATANEPRDPGRRPQRRAARARRLEPQADAARRLAHADRMREARPPCRRPAAGSTPCARFVPEPEKLYTWWSYRAPDWADRRQGPPPRPHLGRAGARRPARRRRGDRKRLRAAGSGRPTTCR